MYRVQTDGKAMQQIAALPHDALAPYAEALGVLELVQWNGAPRHKSNPDASREGPGVRSPLP